MPSNRLLPTCTTREGSAGHATSVASAKAVLFYLSREWFVSQAVEAGSVCVGR